MTDQFKSKTHAQIRRMFGLGNRLGCGKNDLEELAWEVSNGRVGRLSGLSFDEANAMIVRLGGNPFPNSPPARGGVAAVSADGVVGVPRRTVNYRRQKAGIPQIATTRHLNFMRDLAQKRGITEDGLERLCRRMIDKPRPRTTAETSKIIEALKAMVKRGPLPAAAGGTREAA